MPTGRTFGWLEVDQIAEALAEVHPQMDPLQVRFTDLRKLVEALPRFQPETGHPVNERILEVIQMKWREERAGLADDDD